MYKQLNISMDSIFIQMHINGTRKDISINKIRDYKNYNLCWNVYKPENSCPPPGPPSLNSKLTRKGKLGKNKKCSKGTKGCIIKYMQATKIMDFIFLSLQFLPVNVSK